MRLSQTLHARRTLYKPFINLLPSLSSFYPSRFSACSPSVYKSYSSYSYSSLLPCLLILNVILLILLLTTTLLFYHIPFLVFFFLVIVLLLPTPFYLVHLTFLPLLQCPYQHN